MLTWQELSAFLPEPLREFLNAKYGIAAPGETPSITLDENDLEFE
jgi:hypothetical protein